MRLLLATNHLGLGGSESYLLTVAEQLDRLAHEVEIYAPEMGNGVEAALERGLAVVGEPGLLSRDFDAALVQDSGVSYQVAEHFPGMPQLFVAHSETFDLQAPPQLEGAVGAVVVLNDRVERRLRSFAVGVEIVRLRQPIDTDRFLPHALPARARHALLLSNTPNADRIALVEAACAEAGLELARLGGRSRQTTDPRASLTAADIVIGYGRSILEAMACGRAAYVYDWAGGDGWVTPDSYAAIEAGGFAGRTGDAVIDAERLANDLRNYDASMGLLNRDLVMAHHRANAHAQQLVELFGRISAPQPRPRAPLDEMARLVRLEWHARTDAHTLLHENVQLRERLEESEEARVSDARRAEERVQAYEQTASWRVTRPLRAVGKALRRHR